MIVAVVGQPSSGKDTIAQYLETKGFRNENSGDVIREEMGKLGIPTDRANMSVFSAEKRKERGSGHIAEKILGQIKGDTVISGLRHTEEIKVFKNQRAHTFFIIAVTAPLEVRYRRAQGRGRAGDEASFEKFKRIEDQERNSVSHQVDKVIASADFLIINDSSEADLYKKVDNMLNKVNQVLSTNF